MAKARWFKESDRPLVEAALYRHRDRLVEARREWSSLLSADATTFLDGMLDTLAAVMVGDYFVVFQISGSWMTPGAKFFEEFLVLRVSNGAGTSLRSVVREMERIARLNGCVGMEVGTFGAYDGRLARIYQKLGFKNTPAQFFKEL